MKNNKNILVLAPHPDDETLGCGGTLLKHIKSGFNVYCVIFTKINKKDKMFSIRKKEIDLVKKNILLKIYLILILLQHILILIQNQK